MQGLFSLFQMKFALFPGFSKNSSKKMFFWLSKAVFLHHLPFLILPPINIAPKITAKNMAVIQRGDNTQSHDQLTAPINLRRTNKTVIAPAKPRFAFFVFFFCMALPSSQNRQFILPYCKKVYNSPI